MAYNIGRLIPGLILVLAVYISFVLKLDLYLLIITYALIIYDLYKSKLISFINSFFILLISVIIFFFSNKLSIILNNLYILEIFIIFFIIFWQKYRKYLFIISVLLFCLIMFNISITDRNLFYTTILIAFLNDTVAYIVGKTIGGPLIIPKISPKKTWSGTSVSFLVSFILLIYLEFNIFISIIVSALLFLGDIFFSFIKRFLKIKDFSNSLKGHGGILDRIDSMFFAIILFQSSLINL